MKSHANITIIGRIGNEPELRHTKDGKAVLSLSVAVNEGRRDNQTTSWFKVVLWERHAEGVAPYLRKGQAVFAQGRPSIKEWTDKEGQTRSSVEIRCFDLVMLSGEGPDARDRGADRNPTTAQRGSAKQGSVPYADDDDIPW